MGMNLKTKYINELIFIRKYLHSARHKSKKQIECIDFCKFQKQVNKAMGVNVVTSSAYFFKKQPTFLFHYLTLHPNAKMAKK